MNGAQMTMNAATFLLGANVRVAYEQGANGKPATVTLWALVRIDHGMR